MKRIIVSMLLAALLLGACGAKEGIQVRDAWARASTQGMNSAVYFVIQNHHTYSDDLIGTASNVAEAVEIHESSLEGDVMKMNRRESVALAPSGKVEFAPGGLHIMLIGLKQDLKVGDEIEVALLFRNNPDILVQVTVREVDGTGAQNMDGHNP